MKKHELYNVGIYCRLSIDDIGNGDSSSIATQKEMLSKYVHNHGWTVADCYVDDGYSGTNFNRPGFQSMVDDIENGKINMVVVKDLSRLGRNYIQTGQYTDIFFPDRGVRFIALNDGIDSINSDNDIAPFRNILNQMYSTDISKKVMSALRAKKQQGLFLGNFAPYGYQKDPTNKNKLIVEESGAINVKRMYDLCASGHGTPYIAKVLNRENIPSPRKHRGNLNPKYMPKRQLEWTPEAVHHILRSRLYKGDMVQGTHNCSRFKRTPTKRNPPEEWYITPGTHEAIINDDLWHYVQKCMDTRKRVQRGGEPQLFSGFIKCADCGYALAYAKKKDTEYYSCGLYRRKGKDCCSQHYINKKMLVEVVLDDIRRYAKMAVEDVETLAEKLALQYGNSEGLRLQALSDELKIAKSRHTELDHIIEQLYEDKVAKRLTAGRFQKLSEKYEAEQSAIEKKIDVLITEIQSLSEKKKDTSAWVELIKEYADIQELDRIVLGELIEKVTVGETKIIDGAKHVEITIYYRIVGAVGTSLGAAA